MNGVRDRAWRFLLPDLDVRAEEAGLRIAPTGGIAMVAGEDSIRQSLMLLLSTVPGERVMRPDYGCDLRRLVFWPVDDTAAGLAVHYVRQAIERWEPRVEIVRLDAERNTAEPGQLDVILEYRVRATRQMDEMTIGIDMSGEGS
jgi:phage baseplate assembly protein W